MIGTDAIASFLLPVQGFAGISVDVHLSIIQCISRLDIHVESTITILDTERKRWQLDDRSVMMTVSKEKNDDRLYFYHMTAYRKSVTIS